MKSVPCKASFFTDFDLRSCPFDEQILPIEIEDRINTTNSLIYIFDANNSGIDPNATLIDSYYRHWLLYSSVLHHFSGT